jgi:hypothetical protein
VLSPDTLYESSLKANRRTAECRMSNVEGRFRFAQSFFTKLQPIKRQRSPDLDMEPFVGLIPFFGLLIRFFIK